MDDIITSILGIALSAVLMFIFPLMTMSDMTDDVSQLTVRIATNEFVEDIRKTGKITPERYSQFLGNIASTGNTYNIEIEAKILDENPSRTTSIRTPRVQGENVYYSVYNTQIINNTIDPQNSTREPKTYYLKEGDIISVSVKNANQTMAQQLKNFFYTVVGKDTYVIAASHSGIVTVTGK